MIDAIRYEPPADGWRTFVVVWFTQPLSLFGSALTFFAVNIWLTQTLYPRPEQREELAFALSALSLATALGRRNAKGRFPRQQRDRNLVWDDVKGGAAVAKRPKALDTSSNQVHYGSSWPVVGLKWPFARHDRPRQMQQLARCRTARHFDRFSGCT